MKSFASDNYAGVLPEVMQALQMINFDHAKAYGADETTARCIQLMQKVFHSDVEVHFVFNGTAANILSLSGCVESYQAVLCSHTSHLLNDESTAPENFLGARLIPIAANQHGKISPELILEKLHRQGDRHAAQVAAVSITQSTEYGTLYTLKEIKEIAQSCHDHGLFLHMDGARFFQAAAALDCSPAQMATETGVDVLSLGGTKMGLMFGEAVVVINPTLKSKYHFRHKQMMQLSSKTRFIAAQFEVLLKNELWRKYATHANSMAKILAEKMQKFPALKITQPVEANAVFAIIPTSIYTALNQEFPFYMWDEKKSEARLMCSFDTTLEDIEKFSHKLSSIIK
jgi:threonine aldolase